MLGCFLFPLDEEITTKFMKETPTKIIQREVSEKRQDKALNARRTNYWQSQQ